MLVKIDFEKDLFGIVFINNFKNNYEKVLFTLLLDAFIEDNKEVKNVNKLGGFYTFIKNFESFISVENYFYTKSDKHRDSFRNSILHPASSDSWKHLNKSLETIKAQSDFYIARFDNISNEIFNNLKVGDYGGRDNVQDVELYKDNHGSIFVGYEFVYETKRNFFLSVEQRFYINKILMNFKIMGWDLIKEKARKEKTKYKFFKRLLM